MGRIKSKLLNEEVRAWEEYAHKLKEKKYADETGLYNGAWRAAILIAILLLSSCSIVKKLHHSEKLKSEIKKDSTGTVTTKTVETINTLVTIPGNEVNATKPLENLLKGEILTSENNGLKITSRYNPQTKNIETKAEQSEKKVPVKMVKETEVKQTAQVHSDQVIKQKVVDNSKDKKSSGGFGWGIGITLLVLIVFGAVIYWLKKQYHVF